MASERGHQAALRVAEGRSSNGTIRYLERSFAELDASSNRAAQFLSERGVRRGTRTLLMVRPGLPLIEICFAFFKLGAVPVVIDPGMGLKGFLSCVKRTEPEALVGIPLAVALSKIFRRTFRSVGPRVLVGKKWEAAIGNCAGNIGMAEADADELAAILFTSGSTGPAKGVQYTHGMFDAQVRLIRDTYGIEPGEVDLPMLPIFALFNPAMGMTTVVPEMNPSRPATVDPAKIVQAIEQNQVTNSFGSPVLWKRIADYCDAQSLKLPSIRRILMAGAPAPVELLERLSRLLPNGMVHTPYGATECLPVSTISAREVLDSTWDRTRAGQGTCVGRLVSEVSAKIVPFQEQPFDGATELEELEQGQIGEVIVTGPSVTETYDRLPGATSKSKWLSPDGVVWHRMGDLGYFDKEGRLWFCGRAVEQVVTTTGVLFTDQVEAVFNQLPGVFRSALIGLGQAPRQIPAVVLEFENGKSLRVDELIEQASRFPHTEVIKNFFVSKGFPVDVRHNAKIHRLTLKKEFEGKKAL